MEQCDQWGCHSPQLALEHTAKPKTALASSFKRSSVQPESWLSDKQTLKHRSEPDQATDTNTHTLPRGHKSKHTDYTNLHPAVSRATGHRRHICAHLKHLGCGQRG